MGLFGIYTRTSTAFLFAGALDITHTGTSGLSFRRMLPFRFGSDSEHERHLGDSSQLGRAVLATDGLLLAPSILKVDAHGLYTG